MSEDHVEGRCGEDAGSLSYEGDLADLIQILVSGAGVDPEALTFRGGNSSDFGWIMFGSGFLPRQGWKLHITATTRNALLTLEQVVPALAGRGVAFKVVRRIHDLELLNAGIGGASQIGKFITVYPANNAQALELAAELHDLTVGLGGVSIPSDLPYLPGSAVYYRYGAFDSDYLQLPNGEIVPAIRRPDGEMERDRRETKPIMPDWVENPFPTQNMPLPEPILLVGKRYLLTGMISVSLFSQVLMAVDLENARACVIKRFNRSVTTSTQNQFASEADVLSSLTNVARIPRVIELFSDDEYDYMVLSYVGRSTLSEWLIAQHKGTLEVDSVIPKLLDIAATLEAIHCAGYAHGDVKTTNIVIDANEVANLIDFGATIALDTPHYGPSIYTTGYVTRARVTGGAPSVQDDIHGLGAVLYALVTGAEPSRAPNPSDLLTRQPRLLNPACTSEMQTIIERALAEDKTRGYARMSEFQRDLAEVTAVGTIPPFGQAPRTLEAHPEWARASAERLARRLIASAQVSSEGARVTWYEPHPVSNGAPVRDLQVGSAGIILALAELHDGLHDLEVEPLLRIAAWSVIETPHFVGGPLPGLMVGEAGIGLAVIRAGQVLGDAELLAVGAERVASTARLPHHSPDFFNGSAGRLLAHLIAWDATKDETHRRAAEIAGNALLKAMVVEGDEGYWVIPKGFGLLSGARHLGYAHGAAGIADTLLILYEESGEQSYRDAAGRAANWIKRQAVPSGRRGRIDWPGSPGESPYWPVWCHGSAGIGQFLMRVARLDLVPHAAQLMQGAAIAAARGARMTPPVQCHGLAGNIEFLLDAYQLTGDETFLVEAQSLGDVLAGSELRDGDGTAYYSDATGVISPAYWIGFSGVAMCLLRLAEPDLRPRQLTREGFRFRVAGKSSVST